MKSTDKSDHHVEPVEFEQEEPGAIETVLILTQFKLIVEKLHEFNESGDFCCLVNFQIGGATSSQQEQVLEIRGEDASEEEDAVQEFFDKEDEALRQNRVFGSTKFRKRFLV